MAHDPARMNKIILELNQKNLKLQLTYIKLITGVSHLK